MAKTQLLYQFPWGIMASVNLQHQTGRAYARQVRVSGLGFPTAPQINMEPHTGDRRVADVNLIDLRASEGVPPVRRRRCASRCSWMRST